MNPLLAPLTEEQQKLLALLLAIYRQHRSWPLWQFVEQSMDLEGVDASGVMSNLPQLGRKHGIYGLAYGLTWTPRALGTNYQLADPVGLTVLGSL
jgi:hypothetical protein